jgi:hypothetical protein
MIIMLLFVFCIMMFLLFLSDVLHVPHIHRVGITI